MVNTILFDLDGTLIPFVQEEFIRAYFKALVRRLAPMGYDGEKLVSAIWKGTGAMIANDGSRTNRQVFWESFTGDLGMAAMALESILENFYARDFDGVRSVLRRQADRHGLMAGLRQKGYGLVLATNPIFPAVAVATRMSWVGLAADDFDYVTTYENSRYSKPELGYYRNILNQIGRSPEECCMVGNNPVDDMSALKLGLEGYLVTDFLEDPANTPLEAFRRGSFQELEAFLSALPEVG